MAQSTLGDIYQDSPFNYDYQRELEHKRHRLAKEQRRRQEEQAMQSPYCRLNHSDHDIGYQFRRATWADDLYFMWNKRRQKYMYMNNSNVGDGVLKASDITRTPITKETEMEKRNVNYIGTDYQVVEVVYIAGSEDKVYVFKTDRKLVVDDMVVVESVTGLDICRVVSDSVEKSLDTKVIKMFNKATAWVVDLINMDNQEKRRLATERKKFIMDQLAERKEAMEEVAIYKMLAEQDPDAKKLLEELEKL